MKLRRRQPHVVLLSTSVRRANRYGTPAIVRTRGKGGVRRLLRTGVLLTVIGLIGLVRAARPRRRLLTGLAIAAVTVILRDSLWGLVFFMVLLLYLPPWSPQVA
jgi:hypothetical protein